MKNTKVLTLTLATFLVALFPASVKAEASPTSITLGGTEAFPVKVFVERADLQLMAYFSGNPSYSAIEAWVHTKGFPKDKPSIRVILTKPNGDQEDYVNYFNNTGPISNSNGRIIYSTPISLKSSPDKRDWLLSLNLVSGQTCMFFYSGTSAPDKQWGGITNPGNHSLHTALPMMYREKSGMGDDKSYVRVGSHQYTVDPDNAASFPPFFYGRKAYLTVGFQSIIIPAFSGTVKKVPTKKLGTAILGENSHLPRLQFNPPVPDPRTMKIGETIKSSFTSDFVIQDASAEYKSQNNVTGQLILTKTENQKAVLTIQPIAPAWAQMRRLIFLLSWDAAEMQVTAESNDPKNSSGNIH